MTKFNFTTSTMRVLLGEFTSKLGYVDVYRVIAVGGASVAYVRCAEGGLRFSFEIQPRHQTQRILDEMNLRMERVPQKMLDQLAVCLGIRAGATTVRREIVSLLEQKP